jgi:hypothetical protein
MSSELRAIDRKMRDIMEECERKIRREEALRMSIMETEMYTTMSKSTRSKREIERLMIEKQRLEERYRSSVRGYMTEKQINENLEMVNMVVSGRMGKGELPETLRIMVELTERIVERNYEIYSGRDRIAKLKEEQEIERVKRISEYEEKRRIELEESRQEMLSALEIMREKIERRDYDI